MHKILIKEVEEIEERNILGRSKELVSCLEERFNKINYLGMSILVGLYS